MRTFTRRNLGMAAFGAVGLLLAACANQGGMDQPKPMDASKVNLTATLNGASEVPAHNVPGTGTATIVLDKSAHTISWEISYTGLTGDAKAAHFHGPADPGQNAGVAIPIAVGPSPIKGQAILNDREIAALTAGKWYVNIHTAANPGGEIRGQVTGAP